MNTVWNGWLRSSYDIFAEHTGNAWVFWGASSTAWTRAWLKEMRQRLGEKMDFASVVVH